MARRKAVGMPRRSGPAQNDVIVRAGRMTAEKEPVATAQPRPGHRPPVHSELLAQGEVLEGELAMTAAEERAESKQVEQAC